MIISVYFDLNDDTSIKKAEKKKLKLENEGYRLISEDIGCLTGRFIYKKEGE